MAVWCSIIRRPGRWGRDLFAHKPKRPALSSTRKVYSPFACACAFQVSILQWLEPRYSYSDRYRLYL